MTSEFIKHIIESECQQYDLIVLKGFSPTILNTLANDFSMLDEYIFENGKIVLENINESRFMLSILSYSASKKAICSCESLIKMCTQIAGLDILQKKICVLENNMLELYPNPTTTDIPDFDSDDFMDTDGETALYCAFYSFCINEEDMQRVQYIDNYSMSNTCVTIKKLAEPLPYELSSTIHSSSDTNILSTRDGSLNAAMEYLYDNMNLLQTEYAVEAEEADEERIRAFVTATRMFGLNVSISKVTRDLNIQPRPELYDLLKRIWGYESFRLLKIYKDLTVNHDVTEISQGSIIETVVQQAEHAYRGEKDKVNNILLTSPTGAGKSLLFQLSAICLAEKYGLLTIGAVVKSD